ncbi:MAG: hypothetical protein JNL70_08845 [Saprospiraceae bacterium]|nr:hypothetical protein [Saprospiraceae bacterium]
MNSSLLLQYLKILDKKERKELSLFLQSPFHNTQVEVTELFDYLCRHLDSPSVVFEKTAVFTTIFPGKKNFNDVLLRQTMSALTHLIRQYLAWKSLQNDSGTKNLLLIKSLQERQAERLFERELNDAFTDLERQPHRHADYHRQRFDLFAEESKVLNRRQRSGDLRLQEMHDELTQFYSSELLRQAATMHSHQSVSKRHYEQPFLPDILRGVLDGKLQSVSVSAYYFAHRALSKDAEVGDFQELKNIIVVHWQSFPSSELRDLYLLAINFCIRQLNRGVESFNREALDLYKNGLNNGALLENGNITPYTYNNALRLAIKTDDWAWAESFLITFKNKLPAREREATFRYNQALFFFRKKDYPQAMTLLQQVNTKEVLYNLDARQMLMRIYYDLGEWSALDSLLESFKIYLHRQNNIGYHRESYLNLIKFTNKILKTDLSNAKQRDILRGQIEATTLVTEKGWLLEKLVSF